MIKKTLAALGVALLAATAVAQGSEADVRKNVEAALGNGAKVDSVRKAGALGLYEVVVGGEIFYTDDKANHILAGHLFELKTGKDLTQERLSLLTAVKFDDLPLNLAIRKVRGKGTRKFAYFGDPNCGYCKRFEQQLVNMDDVTIYTFLYPILSQDSVEKSKAIWCASDRTKAWTDTMLTGNTPSGGKCDTAALDKVMTLAHKLRINGTPAIFLADGTRLPGYMPAAQLEQAIAQAAATVKQ